MRIVWFCWYISGMSAVLFVLSSLISYAPGAEAFGTVIQAVAGCSTLAVLGLGILLNQHPGHWIHRSTPLWAVFVAVAVTVTVLVVLVG